MFKNKKAYYFKIKNEVFNQLNALSPEKIIPFVPDRDDILDQTYTLVLFLDDKLNDQLFAEINKLKEIDPRHLYLVRDKLHITLIGEISSRLDSSDVVKICEETLKKYKISFNINGFASNRNSASVLAYPEFSIHNFRNDIRNKLSVSGTDYTKHLSVYEHIGWVNYMRYLTVPYAELLHAMIDRSNFDFGNFNNGKIKLLNIKSRTLKDGFVSVVHNFN